MQGGGRGMKKIYAVVDLETTGTDTKTDRIIQFGCVLVQEGRIINRFATDVNPDRKIPKQIQNLTHISNEQVKKAPYFEDIAATIYHLLSDTIFVAHNIYFDYNFLNCELKRCGLPEINIPGIDTVELAQVFLPTEASFRLSDLAESLGLDHLNPHQADSDAEVTAALLLYIEAIMKELPMLTLEKIYQLSGQMGMQTGEFIGNVVHQRRETHETALPPDLKVVDGIVLKRKTVPLYESLHYENSYPKEKSEKQKVFKKILGYRKEQARLMNAVYTHFTQSEEKNLMIEAETGMGKTIGYLFPGNYLATPEKPLIISTVSLLLQQQIMKKDIPMLNRLLDHPIQATIVKSHRHYIDLQRFKATLNQPIEQKQYAQYQMAILVWLTKTETGDFDELNIIQLNHPLFVEIRHRGVQFLAPKQSFYEEDFVRHLYACMDQSNMLIVNHAFLMQETVRETPLLKKSPYLLIDETQHLPEIAESVAHRRFDSLRFKRQILQMQEDGLLKVAGLMVKDDYEMSHLLEMFNAEITAIIETQEAYIHSLDMPSDMAKIVMKQEIQNGTLYQDKLLQKLQLFYQEIIEIQEKLQQLFEQNNSKWLNRERIIYAKMLDLFVEIKNQAALFDEWLNNWQPRYVHGLQIHPDHQTAVIELSDLEADYLPASVWYKRYEKIIFIGGTLKVPGDKAYFAKRLGIANTKVTTIPSAYDYSEQARLLVVQKGMTIQELSAQEYAQYLADILKTILFQNPQPALVLFTSHDILKRVYELLNRTAFNQGREIMAQGMGGTREKIVKRFLLAENGILFGTDSFWEGLDLPGDALRLVIVTRLPFDNPKRPMVQARYAYLEHEGHNAFFKEALPKATLKLRQALGRLIRSEKDKGVLIVLDRRLLSTKYGKKMLKGLPKRLPLIEAEPVEMSELISDFFADTATD